MNDPGGPPARRGAAQRRAAHAEVEAFIGFLDSLPRDIRVLGILGDLFSTWIGRRELCRPHQAVIVEALRRLRRRGCQLIYVEGNHDFFLDRLYDREPFDKLANESLDLRLAGRRIHLAHGDLINRRDLQYRVWRGLSKNRLFFGLFNLVPRRPRQWMIDAVENSLARTNVKFRGGLPVAECEAYARPRIRDGVELLVFGHFHEERQLEVQDGERRGTVFVLPAWRSDHRYLRIDPGADPVFTSS